METGMLDAAVLFFTAVAALLGAVNGTWALVAQKREARARLAKEAADEAAKQRERLPVLEAEIGRSAGDGWRLLVLRFWNPNKVRFEVVRAEMIDEEFIIAPTAQRLDSASSSLVAETQAGPSISMRWFVPAAGDDPVRASLWIKPIRATDKSAASIRVICRLMSSDRKTFEIMATAIKPAAMA